MYEFIYGCDIFKQDVRDDRTKIIQPLRFYVHPMARVSFYRGNRKLFLCYTYTDPETPHIHEYGCTQF